MVIGRSHELDVIRSFVGARDGGPAALVIEGEPGIGKTTLLSEAAAEALGSGCRVLSAAPAEPDAELAFATLSDLLGPLMPSVRDELPEPQRHALAVALLDEASPRTTDARAVSAAVLSTFRAALERGPVVVAIDDAQWIDPATERALAFAIRRVTDGSLRAVLTVRTEATARRAPEIERSFPATRLTRVALGPLDPDSLASVIERELGGQLSRREMLRIHDQSGGNPFFAVELARAAQRGDDRPTGLALPIPKTLRDDVVRGRFAELSPSTLELLLVASATSRPTPALLAAVLGDAPIDRALDEAEAASVIRVDQGEIRFAHPLLRSSVYADASRSHRHRIHAAIAAVVEDREERGLHLALSTDDPDVAVAAEIERAAESAAARGAPDAAADLLRHAIRLTAPDDRASLSRRLLAAGEDRFLAGDAVGGLADAARASDLATPGPERAHALARLGDMELVADRYAESRAHLEAALDEEGLSDALVCGIHADLFWVSLALGDHDGASAHADTGLDLARTVSELAPRARAYAAAAHARFVHEGGIADDLIAEDPELWEALEGLPMKDWPRVTLAAEAVESGDLARGSALVLELLSTAEARGDDLIREELLDRQAEVCLQSGAWLEGRDVSRSCRDLELQLYGTASESARLAWFEGALGDAERARADVDQALESDRAVAWTKRWARAALGMVELSLGRPEAALDHLEALGADRPPPGVGDPGIAWCFLPDLIEALVHVGRAADGDDHAAWLEERGRALERPWAIATGARCRGLILAADGVLDVAIERLEFALEAHERLPMPYERGRTLLALGTVRRRAGRKRLAREALDEAGSVFATLGAVGWRQRVDAELGHITGRRPSAGRLTDAEQRVARLAAAGFRNREIAAQLFMSVRTVEGHLSDVYAKLSIRSRTELAVFFGEADDPASPGSGTSVVDR